jgi:hypothetical protein
MNILRAFGEQIGIFAAPERSRQMQAALHLAPEPPAKPQTPEPAVATIEAEIPHCCFYCAWCASPILLPHDSLGFAFGGPMIRKIEARSIGTVCASCAHVATYSLFRGCQGFNTRHRFLSSLLKGRTVLVDWLQCQEETCVFRLPFFLTFDELLTEQNLKEWAPQWEWDGLACSVGHPVDPPKWLFEMRPHRQGLDLTRVGVQRFR